MLVLAARLADADKRLQRELRKRFTEAAKPVAAKARQAIESAPSHHGGRLRSEIAGTVRVSVSTSRTRGPSVAIVSEGRKMPPGKDRLPLLFDDRMFRHPVFGGRAGELSVRRHGRGWTWVYQRGHPGWFHETIAREKERFQQAALEVLDETARHLEGH